MKKTLRLSAILWLMSACSLPVFLSAQTLNTIAGTGVNGFGGDGNAATSAQLSQPYRVAVDGAGNVYIADYNNHRIRKITKSTGNISTIAGTGTGGYNGDGIAATTSRLYYPAGVALDAAGNVYVADYYNHRIRKITVSTGMISTLAGSGSAGYNGDGIAATSAQLYNPTDVAVDGFGDVYVADYANSRIRKIRVSTGTISTVAGDGSFNFSGDGASAVLATLSYPSGVSVDAAGNVFIADQNNHRIRKISASTGDISTIAGTGVGGYNGDGIAATSAHLNYPYGVTSDAAGNVYIADMYNHRIRKVEAGTVMINTIAGTGIGGYNGNGLPATSTNLYYPPGVAVDGTGIVYLADDLNHRVRSFAQAELPVELLSFTGRNSASGNILDWVTAGETNNDHFEIERSADGVAFTFAGTVKGAGNSTTTQVYSFIDNDLSSHWKGGMVYRLKQVDFDGVFEYFGPVVVKRTSLEGLILVHDPVLGMLWISSTGENEPLVEVEILDISGRVVTRETGLSMMGNTIQVDISSLAPGTWFVRAGGPSLAPVAKRFIVQ